MTRVRHDLPRNTATSRAHTPDTNNLLTLFTKLYSDNEVLRKVVVVKADKYTWWANHSTATYRSLTAGTSSSNKSCPALIASSSHLDPDHQISLAWVTSPL